MTGKTVLIIDDDAALVGSVKDYLETTGFKVAVAFDGLQGVLQAHQARPDLIFLDFNMPGGGGASVYERLRNANDTCRIPIVFTTGVHLDAVKGSIKPSAQTFFLRKPVTLGQISAVLAQVLRIEAPAAPSSASAVPAGLPPAVAPPPSPPPIPPALSPPVLDAPRPVLAPPPLKFEPPAAAPSAPAVAAPENILRGQLSSDAVSEGAAPKSAPKRHEFEARVTYADTDKLGIIYYANYFKYFELGRTELLRSLGVRYRDLEVERKLYLPVVEARCEYLGPSRYDDLLIVKTWLSCLGKASVCFQNEIWDRDSADRLVARGYSRHAVVNDRWRPARLPGDLRLLLGPFVAAAPAGNKPAGTAGADTDKGRTGLRAAAE